MPTIASPTWPDLEYHDPALASKLDLEFVADWADHGDIGDLLTAIEARRMDAVLRIGDMIARDRAGFRERRLRAMSIDHASRDDG